MRDQVNQIIHHLDPRSVESMTGALDAVKEINDLNQEEKSALTKALCEVFYHAHHTGSTTMPKVAVRTEKRIARFGPEMIPFIFDEMLDSDSESAVYFGKTLARNGLAGLEYVLAKLEDYKTQDHDLINLIQTVSYFKVPEAVHAIPLLLSLAQHTNHQVTSMSLYTTGRLAQTLPHSVFNDELKLNMFNTAFRFLSNAQGLVRKNTAQTLGRMVRKGLLSVDQEKKVYNAFMAITGRDNQHKWDRAFIVRREAEDFLPYFHEACLSVRMYNQSYKIISKRMLCPNTYHYTIDAPLIARKIEAGQFLIVRPHIFSERIPLSVCGWNREHGTIDIIISAVGKTTTEINAMNPGDPFQDVVGPLGERSFIPASTGTCVVIGGGYGTGAIIPTAMDLQKAGNKVIGVVGARNQENVIMLVELGKVCDEVMVTTNDGSLGNQGLVTDALAKILEREQVTYVLAVGPVPMMKAISELTRYKNIPTYVSLNAIMVDGTGMCGACRVTVGGETKFACFHGPDFDGHKVDFENLMKRQKMFAKEERLALSSMNT